VSERCMTDLRNDYVFLLNWLVREGKHVTSRGLATRELTGVTLDFPYGPRCMLPIGVNRGVNLRLVAVEALQLLAGVNRPDLIERAAPAFNDVLVDPNNPDYGAYGPRIATQLPAVVDLLRTDPATRRAIVTIFEPRDLYHNGDRPCTLNLGFLLRNDQLELHTTMRSQDAFLGLTYDLFSFTQIQETLARLLNVGVGRVTHHVYSLHVYESDLDRVAKLQTTDVVYPELPHGIDVSDDVDPFMRAAALLNNVVTQPGRDTWYVRQIGKLYD